MIVHKFEKHCGINFLEWLTLLISLLFMDKFFTCMCNGVPSIKKKNNPNSLQNFKQFFIKFFNVHYDRFSNAILIGEGPAV